MTHKRRAGKDLFADDNWAMIINCPRLIALHKALKPCLLHRRYRLSQTSRRRISVDVLIGLRSFCKLRFPETIEHSNVKYSINGQTITCRLRKGIFMFVFSWCQMNYEKNSRSNGSSLHANICCPSLWFTTFKYSNVFSWSHSNSKNAHQNRLRCSCKSLPQLVWALWGRNLARRRCPGWLSRISIWKKNWKQTASRSAFVAAMNYAANNEVLTLTGENQTTPKADIDDVTKAQRARFDTQQTSFIGRHSMCEWFKETTFRRNWNSCCESKIGNLFLSSVGFSFSRLGDEQQKIKR